MCVCEKGEERGGTRPRISVLLVGLPHIRHFFASQPRVTLRACPRESIYHFSLVHSALLKHVAAR